MDLIAEDRIPGGAIKGKVLKSHFQVKTHQRPNGETETSYYQTRQQLKFVIGINSD